MVIELPVEPLAPDAYLKRHTNERYVQSPVDVIRYVLEQV